MKSKPKKSFMFGILHDTDVIKGLAWAGSGITISELELWTGWIELAIKFVSFLIILIVLAKHINQYKKTMNIPDNGDNEDGSGEPLPPPEDDGDDN